MGLFPALLKHWRSRRGLSQLDLALTANVSARHISFLETGRAKPSDDMVLRLANALSVPLRDQNEMLTAAGFAAAYAQDDAPIEGVVAAAIERMLDKHEPYPMIVMDRTYNVLRTNHGAAKLLPRLIADAAALQGALNACRLLFDPRLARPYVMDWEPTAKTLLSRLHREALAGDAAVSALIQQLLAYPDVPQDWQHPDLSQPNLAVMPLRLRRSELDVAFLTTVTSFNAPQNVTLDELRIESYFPLDDKTVAYFG